MVTEDTRDNLSNIKLGVYRKILRTNMPAGFSCSFLIYCGLGGKIVPLTKMIFALLTGNNRREKLRHYYTEIQKTIKYLFIYFPTR